MAPFPHATLFIEKIIHGGPGLARTEGGEIVLVPGTLPGERVDVVLEGRRHGVAAASLYAVLESSPDRRLPACPFFGECGGCDWLFIDYSGQVRYKKEIFLESMCRIGKFSSVPEPEIFSSSQFGYRRRTQLKIDESGKVGFFRRKTNDVIGLKHCPILTDRLNAILQRLAVSPVKLPDRIRNIRVIDGDTAAASDPPLHGSTFPTTTISCCGYTFEVGGADFFQSNRFLLEPMARWVMSRCAGGSVAADIYGGTGFFTVMIAGLFDKVCFVETDFNMVERAKANFHSNRIHNVQAVAARAESIEQFLSFRPDAVVIDPPRPGLTRRVREAIARLAPKTILYVSCNCATQARDCGFFVKKAGYNLTSAAVFDCYPNTHHLESMVLLQSR